MRTEGRPHDLKDKKGHPRIDLVSVRGFLFHTVKSAVKGCVIAAPPSGNGMYDTRVAGFEKEAA